MNPALLREDRDCQREPGRKSGVQSGRYTLLQLHLILPFGRVKKRMRVGTPANTLN